jgi:hypothetical protein
MGDGDIEVGTWQYASSPREEGGMLVGVVHLGVKI